MSNQVLSNKVLARTFAGLATAALFAVGTLAAATTANADGIGGNMGMNHPTTVNLTPTKTTNLSPKIVDRDRRRFRFIDVGAAYVTPVPACFYKWTSLGRVRICPDPGY